ncbi:hypothetical protein F5Y11DRAFT_343122 [Daldinia sp. FL1419]|nr:hypothetical protein F5Y11DRAFT_343122 [Daldinia sp. FL1419]
MDHEHTVTIEVEKQEEYTRSSADVTPSTSPPPPSDQGNPEPPYATSPRSCFFCRKTLLLSYFNCCAVCLGVIQNTGASNSNEASSSNSLPLPTTQPQEPSIPSAYQPSSPPSNQETRPPATALTCSKPRHCPSPYCRYTHTRPLMLLFALSEAVPLIAGLVFLNAALYSHDWVRLRFAGLLVLQWWQIFVLPRQWARGRSVVAGQLVACLFMVWFYVEASRSWKWWEPFVVSTVLLKIVFPW